MLKKVAKYWERIDDVYIRCTLCPHFCQLRDGAVGLCRIRRNEAGKMIAEGYGKTTSLVMDPIEKKPLFHFKPGSYILSVGPNGCNLRCQWCQNWQISQASVTTQYIPPEKLVKIAKRESSVGIAFTYTEPIIWYEYILDVAQMAREEGLSIVLVTNGYINPEPLEELLNYVDAMNIDLKSMKDEIYTKYIGGHLEPVLKTIEMAVEKCLVEVTNLLIPTLNDFDDDIKALVDFVADISPKIPLHFSRYYPCYHLNIPATSPEKLIQARQIATERLDYVYIGNLRVSGAEDTLCPQCGNMLVRRSGFIATVVGISDGKCSLCGVTADFIM